MQIDLRELEVKYLGVQEARDHFLQEFNSVN
jgi:hypothetical protein